jgi:ribonucleoside-diphosphate reductase alpha chain
LTVDEHVRDLAGWAKWMDSSISKTVNVAFDYPYEDFKNIYLDAFKSGYIKGITTYRAGTMTSVLSSSSNDVEDEEIILEDVKLPDSSPSVLKVIRDSRYKWYLTVCFFDKDHKRPFALFVKTNYREPSVQTEKATECLINLAKDKGVPTKYIEDLLLKSKYDNNPDKIARAISLNLRHGVLIKNIVSALDLVDEVIVGSFVYQIKKFLGGFVKDGTSVEGAVCGACGSSNLEFNEGCVKCRDCGSSKC